MFENSFLISLEVWQWHDYILKERAENIFQKNPKKSWAHLPVWFAGQLEASSGLPNGVAGQADVLPRVPLRDGLQDESLVTRVPGHSGHLVQQQAVMVPAHLTLTLHSPLIRWPTWLAGALSMEQVMKADLPPLPSDLISASPDLTVGGSKWVIFKIQYGLGFP